MDSSAAAALPGGGARRERGKDGGRTALPSPEPLRGATGCSLELSFLISSRQPWALVGILGGDPFLTAEDKREYDGNGTTGLAVAQREFLTYDGTRFTVTAFSGWIKGFVFADNCLSSVALLSLFSLL